MARTWTGAWTGGRTRLGRNGETVWVIESMRRGKRYTISLQVQGEPRGKDKEGNLVAPAEVMAELALFERDPAGYQEARERDRAVWGTSGDVGRDVNGGLVLNATLITEYEEDCRHGDPKYRISEKHLRDNRRYLERWMEVLKGKSLDAIKLAEYRSLVRTLNPRRQHVAALRALTHWLRREGRLESAVDASRDLEIPHGAPKRSQRVLGYSMEQFEKLYAAIISRPFRQRGIAHHTREEMEQAVLAQLEGASVESVIKKHGISEKTFFEWKKKVKDPRPVKMTDAQSVRDVLALRALCGMHHSEVARLAAGDFKVRKLTGHGEIAGTVSVLHKTGVIHPQALGAKALAAALRLQARGRAPEDSYVREMMDEAAERAGLPTMRPGELRHSFVTWARTHGRVVRPAEAGVSLETIARIVGHTSTRTTSTYYDNTEIPELIVLPLKLQNAEDPE